MMSKLKIYGNDLVSLYSYRYNNYLIKRTITKFLLLSIFTNDLLCGLLYKSEGIVIVPFFVVEHFKNLHTEPKNTLNRC